MTTLKPAAAAVAALQGCAWIEVTISLRCASSPRDRQIGARDARMGVGGIGAAAGLEDELVHARQLAQDQVEVVDDLEHALQRVVGLQRDAPRPARRRAASSETRGLYFIVQVPKRLMPIMPSVCWLSCR